MEIYKRFDPKPGEYGTYFNKYLNNVKGLSISEAFAKEEMKWNNFFLHLDDSKVHFSYAEGKWTIAQLILHLIDTEAVFASRALRLIRRESQSLLGFDQDDFVASSNDKYQTKECLQNQWKVTRDFFKSILSNANHDDMEFIGLASGSPLSARVTGLIIPGHNLHHFKILKDCYDIET